VNKRLLFVLESKSLLSNQQCGFRKYRGTMDHLMNLEHCISEAFANKEYLVGVFLDIHKAFDMTWRHGILMKLYAHGLRGNLPLFISNFLQDRTFSVKLPSNVISDVFVQENGVPQGSVLSPTLFSVMIDDILSSAPIPRNLKYSLYADDCAIWHSSPYAEFSAGRVQLALNSVQQWASRWGFKFSVNKCVGVVFSLRKVPALNLTLDTQPIPFQNSVKFLGLHFDCRLTWKTHIDNLLVRVRKKINVLKYLSGTSWGADRTSLLMVYKSLIRSHLDYGSPVHGSASEAILRRLDVFQNECLRMCLRVLRCTRVARMEVEADIPPLSIRRQQLMVCYSIKTSRKSTLGNIACTPLRQHHQLHTSPRRPIAVRMCRLGEEVGISLDQADKIVRPVAAPWETPHRTTTITINWLPTTKSNTNPAEARHRFLELASSYPQHLHLYTDGSKMNECG